jgi:hypothetical protein
MQDNNRFIQPLWWERVIVKGLEETLTVDAFG